MFGFLMAFSEVEKRELRKILCKLPSEDLFSLCSTITNGLVSPSEESDAIYTILKYGKKPTDILRRRKVKKSTIFEYLKEENVYVDVNKEKLHFIKSCLEYWGSKCQLQEEDMELCCEETFPDVPESSNRLDVNWAEPNKIDHKLYQMALSFCTWFYDLLKKANDLNCFGPQHFWHDCALKLHFKSPSTYESVNISSGEAVYNCIYDLVTVQGFYFHPNPCIDKSQCEMNRFGFVKIRVSGGLYLSENSVGTFDHVFGLIEYPHETDTTWKIKCIEMYINVYYDISLKINAVTSNGCYSLSDT